MTKKTNSDNTDELLKRIKKLERLLEDEKLRTEAYSRMIDLVEKELNISIREQPGNTGKTP